MNAAATRYRYRGPRIEASEARQSGYFNIGDAAQATGVSAKMIRHYESIGLIQAADRTFANYRIYSENDLHTLRFVKRGRSLGFSIKQIEALLELWSKRGRSSAQVKKPALQHVDDLNARIAEMQAMRDTLQDLANRCHGDERPDCPILEDLACAKGHDQKHP